MINGKAINTENPCTNVAHISANSQLSQGHVQIKLVPINAPYFDGANLLVAAGCTADAYGNFHNEFLYFND